MELYCHLADRAAHTRVRSFEDRVSYNAVNGRKFNRIAVYYILLSTNSLVPSPRPAFRRLQCGTESDGKLGGAWEQGYLRMRNNNR